jgi:NTP pyrophosphatase (non-canonical NTP hydrolase)
MENKQTALDFFMNSLKAESYTSDFWKAYKKAKEMEKEQIVDAYAQGVVDEAGEILDATKDAEQYYNETFGC